MISGIWIRYILNNSLYTILGVKNYPQNIEKNTDIGMMKNVDKININEFNVENFIIKINKKSDNATNITR